MPITIREDIVDNQFSESRRTDDIELSEIITVVWRHKLLVVGITILFAVTSIIFSLLQPNIYKSEALLAPASEEQGGGLGALASQFGGLASIAGINLGANGTIDKTQLAVEVLKSREFSRKFIKKHDILPELMAAKSWDVESNTVSFDEDDYDSDNKKWVREVKAPYKPTPSMQEGYKEFSEIFSVVVSKETGLINVSIEHVSPYIAQQWVKWLVEDINLEMKKRDVTEANRSIKFLDNQIKLTNVTDIRAILYKLIEEQTKTIMFAEVRDEYVFKTIDAAIVPELKAKPRRALIVILFTLFGGIISVTFVILKHFSNGRTKG